MIIGNIIYRWYAIGRCIRPLSNMQCIARFLLITINITHSWVITNALNIIRTNWWCDWIYFGSPSTWRSFRCHAISCHRLNLIDWIISLIPMQHLLDFANGISKCLYFVCQLFQKCDFFHILQFFLLVLYEFLFAS